MKKINLSGQKPAGTGQSSKGRTFEKAKAAPKRSVARPGAPAGKTGGFAGKKTFSGEKTYTDRSTGESYAPKPRKSAPRDAEKSGSYDKKPFRSGRDENKGPARPPRDRDSTRDNPRDKAATGGGAYIPKPTGGAYIPKPRTLAPRAGAGGAYIPGGTRSDDTRNTGPRPDRKPAAPRRDDKAYAPKPYGAKPAGKPPYGAKPYAAKPYGEKSTSASRAPVKKAESPRDNPNAPVWLYGHHAVAAAWANAERECLRLVIVEGNKKDITALLDANPAPHKNRPDAEIVSRADLDRLLPDGAVHQGVGLYVKPLPETSVDDLIRIANTQDRAVILVLDQITDPHNVGAIMRSAAAFGAIGMIVQDRFAPLVNGTLAKIASGAAERIPMVRVVNIARALDEMRENHIACWGLSEHAEKAFGDIAAPAKLALFLGNEGDGLRQKVAEQCDTLLRLPTQPDFPSLNVSNAAAIALFACQK